MVSCGFGQGVEESGGDGWSGGHFFFFGGFCEIFENEVRLYCMVVVIL